MKRFLLVITTLALLGYLVFSALYFNDNAQKKVCKNFIVLVKDSLDKKFIQTKDIETLLRKENLHPIDKQLSTINTLEIEKAIMGNRLVKSVEVYATRDGSIVASIKQRNPVLRVIADGNHDFYIDSERERMPISPHYTVYLPVATGSISEEFAKNELYDFVMYISNHPTWDAWIEQIVVSSNKKVQIVPRAGDFKVTLGTLDDYEVKLDKLKLFIDKGLNTVGWNRYSDVNLEFNNQVVCTMK
ncbi:MAG: cell division protein FtsQ/DivIB [Candidatus Saccharimonadaceae bacterium]